jgi:hypothetical protein
MSVSYGGSNITFEDGSIVSSGSQGFKNKVINGAVMIDQRNAGASVTIPATTVTYTMDRWAAYGSQASKFSVQQNAGSVTPPPGFTNYLGVTSLSAYTVGSGEGFWIRQPIEGYNIADLDWGKSTAKTVTLSFWVRSSLTGTFGGAIVDNFTPYSYPFSYTISSANTWEQKTITITGPTSGTFPVNNTAGFYMIFGLGNGSTSSGTAGAWTGTNLANVTGATSVVGTNAATWYITGVQLEKSTNASTFEFRSYGKELMLCQRYFTAFVADGGIDSFGPLAIGRWYESTSAQFFFTMPTQMRYPPTLDAVNTTAVGTFAVNTGGTFTAAVITGMSLNERSYSTATVSIGYSTGGQTVGQATTLYSDGSDFAKICFTAEL